MASLPDHLLAGHAANRQFWSDEYAHCLSVLNSYEDRYQRMLAVQLHCAGNDPQLASYREGLFMPPKLISRPGPIAEQHRRHVQHEMENAFHRFCDACDRVQQPLVNSQPNR